MTSPTVLSTSQPAAGKLACRRCGGWGLITHPGNGYRQTCDLCRGTTIDPDQSPAALAATPAVGGEPVAWRYEMAFKIKPSDEQPFKNWKQVVTMTPPPVIPKDGVRNVVPLYAAPPASPLRALANYIADKIGLPANERLSFENFDAWFKDARAASPLRARELKLLNSIIDASEDFRRGMPDDWEGDPLQDAIDEARAFVAAAPPEQPAADPVSGYLNNRNHTTPDKESK